MLAQARRGRLGLASTGGMKARWVIGGRPDTRSLCPGPAPKSLLPAAEWGACWRHRKARRDGPLLSASNPHTHAVSAVPRGWAGAETQLIPLASWRDPSFRLMDTAEGQAWGRWGTWVYRGSSREVHGVAGSLIGVNLWMLRDLDPTEGAGLGVHRGTWTPRRGRPGLMGYWDSTEG